MSAVVAHRDDLGGDDVWEAGAGDHIFRSHEHHGDVEVVDGGTRAEEHLVRSMVTADCVDGDRQHGG